MGRKPTMAVQVRRIGRVHHACAGRRIGRFAGFSRGFPIGSLLRESKSVSLTALKEILKPGLEPARHTLETSAADLPAPDHPRIPARRLVSAVNRETDNRRETRSFHGIA